MVIQAIRGVYRVVSGYSIRVIWDLGVRGQIDKTHGT